MENSPFCYKHKPDRAFPCGCRHRCARIAPYTDDPEDPDTKPKLSSDALKFLFALQDAWPYVHQHCTIDSVREKISRLLREHGDSPPETDRKPIVSGGICEHCGEPNMGHMGVDCRRIFR